MSTGWRILISSVVVLTTISGLFLWGCKAQHDTAEQLRRDQWIVEQKDALRTGKQSNVYFYSTSSTDERLNEFAAMPEIKSLTFELTDLTDAGMQTIADLPHIESLALYGGYRPIGDSGLMLLAGKSSITTLKLINTDVTDYGLRVLASLPALADLTLYRESFRKTTLTDAAVQHLRPLSKLHRLNIAGGWMSKKALEELRNDLPRCTIVNNAQW